jgi:hypothetical protein
MTERERLAIELSTPLVRRRHRHRRRTLTFAEACEYVAYSSGRTVEETRRMLLDAWNGALESRADISDAALDILETGVDRLSQKQELLGARWKT